MDIDLILDKINSSSSQCRMQQAKSADQSEILSFYHSSAIEGETIRLRSRRDPDFFHLLKYHSEDVIVLTIEKRADPPKIGGIGTFVFRDGYLNGKVVPIVYLRDLRIQFDRQYARFWRSIVSELCKDKSKYYIMAMIDENRAATNAFLKQPDLTISRLAPYHMVNILGRFLPKLSGVFKSPFFTVSRAGSSEINAIKDFLDQQSRRRPLGFCFSQGEFERRLKTWDRLSIGSFLVIRRAGGGPILGCVAPWSPSLAKSNVIEDLPRYSEFIRPFFRVPRVGEKLRTLYLTHLEVDVDLPRSDQLQVFKTLVDAVYDQEFKKPGSDWHMMSFCDFDHQSFRSALTGYFANTIPMSIVQIVHSDATETRLTQPELEGQLGPGFEIALV